MEQSRVLIVEPSETVRWSLQKAIADEAGMAVVACCGTVEEATWKCRSEQLHAIVLGSGLSGSQRLTAVRRLGRLQQTAPILVLAERPGIHEFLSAVKAGAKGYLAGDNHVPTLIEAIGEVCAGRCVIEPGILGELFAHLAASRSPSGRHKSIGAGQALGKLSPRERQVVALIAQGKTNREIGALLVTSEGTAKTHVRHILRKLKVSDRTGAVLAVLGIDPARALPPV